MKKFALIFALLALVFTTFSSCEDEDITPEDTNHFVGTWYRQATDNTWYFYDDLTYSVTGPSTNLSGSYTYDSNGNMTLEKNGTVDNATYSFSNNYYNLDISIPGFNTIDLVRQ